MRGRRPSTRTLVFRTAVLLIGIYGTGSSISPGQSLSGSVTDFATGEPLPRVNVYVSGTTFGAASDDRGEFLVAGVPPGRHELVASMVGYRAHTVVIRTDGKPLAKIRFRLKREVYSTGEVVVSSQRPKNWERQLKRFEREFVGTSENAAGCTITNPFVLDFEERPATNTLRATASAPLVIENRSLGYRVTFVLDDFEVANWTYRIRYKGRPRFEQLDPADEQERIRWATNRERAYNGSFAHFLYQLARGHLAEAGFEIRQGKELHTNEGEIGLLPVLRGDSTLVPGTTPYEHLFYAPGYLHVIYHGEKESGGYHRFVREVTGSIPQAHGSQYSIIKLDQAITLHNSGYLYEPYLATTYGYWIWERVADMLPRDYRPSG